MEQKEMKQPTDIKLGDQVQSQVSGFSGTVTAICKYLYKEAEYCVTAPVLDGGGMSREWFCAAELVIIK